MTILKGDLHFDCKGGRVDLLRACLTWAFPKIRKHFFMVLKFMLCNNIINSWKTILNGSLVKWCNKTLPNVLGQILSGEENLDITNDKLLEMICILLVEGSGFTACVLIGRHLMGTADQPEVDFCFSFFFHLRCSSRHNSLSITQSPYQHFAEAHQPISIALFSNNICRHVCYCLSSVM